MAKHRVQKLENVNVCLTFLNAKVHLENIGSEDIVDGNERLILGLIWTIILRYQIDDISIDLTQEERQKLYKNEPKSKKYSDILDAKVTSKNALLIWCKRRTKGYHNVDIQNFSSSWKDGLGFLAIIHSYRPDLIDFEDYKTENANRNLKEAFEIAESYLGIYRLLDPEDVNSVYPDEKSILTYLSCLYHFFHNPKLLGKMSPDKKLKKIEIIGNSSLIENDQNIAKKKNNINKNKSNNNTKKIMADDDVKVKDNINKGSSKETSIINEFSNTNNNSNLSNKNTFESSSETEKQSREETQSPSFLQQIKQKLTGTTTNLTSEETNKSPPAQTTTAPLLTSEPSSQSGGSSYLNSDYFSSTNNPSIKPLGKDFDSSFDNKVTDYYGHPITTSTPMSSSTIIKKTITTTRSGGASSGGGIGGYSSSSFIKGGSGGGLGFDSSFAASPKATIAFREKEKKELQDLNERFASYIERVRKLEKQHGELIEEIVAIKNELIRIVSSVRAQYESELRDARKELDVTSRDKARLEVRCNRLEDDIDEYRIKYDDISRLHHTERDKLLRLEVLLSEKDGELANLQKKLDQANDDIDRYKRELARLLDELMNAKITNEEELLIRVDLENKLQSLQEDLDFQQQLHQATLKELMEGIKSSDTGEFKRIFQNELSLAIKDIRTEYENISKMMYPDNEGWYKTKMQEFMELTQKKNVEEMNAKSSAQISRSRVSEISTEIIELRSANSSLEKRIMELERAISNENSDFEAQLAQRDYEMQELQERIAAQLFELRELMDTKLRLDLEIAAYRRLLEGEENRLNLSPESIKHVRKAISQIGTREILGQDSLSKALAGESSTKTTFQRTSKGPLTISEVDPEGHFVSLENTSKLKEQVIDGWQIRRNIDNRENIIYNFPKFTIKPGKTVKVFASGYYDGKPDNLEFRDRRSWGTGSNVTTSLLTDKGEEKASHLQKTISH
ncbi:intermediate filament protein A-like [Gordionus sp. m RMFG-2023]|uniref:intermediate filament protein A-like n=1 Tax=Gordionus sp. m RMFG-2023 TaxID=3053472 RepID=UPI0031FBC656